MTMLRLWFYHCDDCCPGEKFHYRTCPNTVEEAVLYEQSTGEYEEVHCGECDRRLERRYGFTGPGVAGDNNLTIEEKAAIAIHLGFQGEGKDGYMVIPETRSDLKRFKEIHGDIPVTEQEILSERPRPKYQPPPKAETIEQIRKLRAMRRSGNLPRRAVDEETLKAVKSQHEGAEIV